MAARNMNFWGRKVNFYFISIFDTEHIFSYVQFCQVIQHFSHTFASSGMLPSLTSFSNRTLSALSWFNCKFKMYNISLSHN